ncbi:flagellar hook protein FlgE [Biostraticola tofi]|uniref:Flagellar hook protein FlgE n=1 Tax=Biostraticola tofi TaxID=466109 RepID=A0A4R3YSZ8_9GAMM|nr:flagellar hook protein FlgE [Biostraticola tofi]TCV95542.1 flagellar hook protein FlgE [Biostraticola tofi]
MSFSQGISGLNAASQALDVIGNNIANSQTVGFKSSSIAFGDIFSGSQVGLGVQVAGINQNFSDAALTQGSSKLDMGIQGNGFFRLVDEAGKISYSRNGQFKLNADGYIINNQNGFLTGYQATGTPPEIQPGASVGPIQIPNDTMPAKATGSGKLVGNLDSGSENVTVTPFDPENKDSYSYSTQVNAYDSLGNKHVINVYYAKTADNEWKVYSNDTTSPKLDGGGKPVFQTADLKFDSSGKMVPADVKIKVEGAGYKGGEALDFELDLAGTSQQAADNETNTASTDGYSTGSMNGYKVSGNGQVVASYSNGKEQLIAQVVLANFTNPGGLSSKGDNSWTETAESGQPVLGTSNSGTLGSLSGGKLEMSNVDLAQEMVNMIVFQRNYQSNSQTIKTQDQLLQTLVSLR